MADAPVIRSDFYVYALFREDGETPFYIGKGRGSRMFVHERSAHRFTSHKDRIIQNMAAIGIAEIPKVKLAEGLIDDTAKQIERDLIQLLGRWPIGPLANLTSGGDGVTDLSAESRAVKEEKNRLAWEDPVNRERRIAAMAAGRATPEAQKRIQEAGARRRKPPQPKPPRKPISEESRQRRINILRTLWNDPEWRARTIDRRRARGALMVFSDEEKAASSARLNSPEAQAKRHATNLKADVREKRVAAQKAAFSTPEAKAKRSEVSKRVWDERRAHQYACPPDPNSNDPAQPPPQQP